MKDRQLQLIEVDKLRVGMFVHLDLGWLDHPFPFSSFKIRSQDQIASIRELGIARVRYAPSKSDPVDADPAPVEPSAPNPPTPESAQVVEAPERREARQRAKLLLAQQARLEHCECRFREAGRCFREILSNAQSQPVQARSSAEHIVGGMLEEMSASGDMAIRLLSEKAGEESSLHALNCTVLSLLLARACGIDGDGLAAVGTGALLHDIGKIELPDRLRWREGNFTTAERRLYDEHVPRGLAIGQRMGLPPGVCRIIAEHHEADDGSGFPAGLRGDAIDRGARIVALVNQYDNLCNPGNPAQALTPHEALAVMFARMRSRFESATMSVFIRMMGVYPPGSVIELSDGRYALSVSVNASRPLRPSVIIHEPAVPADEALVVDLETLPEIGIRRCIKPVQLPRAVADYLSPRKRTCYYFERSMEASVGEVA